MNMQSYLNHHTQNGLSVRHVSFLRPFHWLNMGIKDLLRHKAASLAYGFLVSTLLLMFLFISSTHPFLIAAIISAFMLMGPIMAAGLCELSRRHETGESISFNDSLEGLKTNQKELNKFALILLAFCGFWFVLSGLLLSLSVGNIAPSFEQTLWGGFMDLITPKQIMLYMLVGGILACVIFAISVVSVPSIIDKHIPVEEAIFLSLKVTLSNITTMFVWASLLLALTSISFLTLLIGMIIIYPLLGHATWYAYRDLVEHE